MAKKRTRKPKPPMEGLPDRPPTSVEGNCFVVVNDLGQVWDGNEWVKTWPYGLQYRRPDPAYEMCDEERQRAHKLTGRPTYVFYVTSFLPPNVVIPHQWPHDFSCLKDERSLKRLE
jgi:hypothetical protein